MNSIFQHIQYGCASVHNDWSVIEYYWNEYTCEWKYEGENLQGYYGVIIFSI